VSAAYDRARLVELFGNDPKTLAEVEREFFDTAQEAAHEIAETDDLDTIARAAHRLKGAAGMIGAAPLHQLAEAIEHAAKAASLQGVRRMQEQLRLEVLRVAEQAALPTAGVARSG
jgi:HPt (histidine-containing phosphotransfer) domain-containing protein